MFYDLSAIINNLEKTKSSGGVEQITSKIVTPVLKIEENSDQKVC